MRIGYVGKLIDGVEVKFGPDDEILVRGFNVMMGYYKDEAKTAEVMTDDWFHTGDIGRMDDGFLKITDRKKEMFKTSAGSTSLLNSWKTPSRPLFIEQVMVVGEGQSSPAHWWCRVPTPSKNGASARTTRSPEWKASETTHASRAHPGGRRSFDGAVCAMGKGQGHPHFADNVRH